MTKYATTHADALADISEAGAAVTFSRSVRSSTPSTGASTVTTSTVAGHAIEVRPNSSDVTAYEGAGLVLSDVLTLLFAPTTYGEVPAVGSNVEWAVETYTVRHVRRLAPDGSAIISRVGVTR